MSIHKELFGTLLNSSATALKFTMKNQHGLVLVCTNFGCTVLELHTPDKDGNLENITICYQTLADLQNPPGRPYFGAIIGRFCNRIEKGHLELEGSTYALSINNGANTLHGGSLGFDRRLWTVVNESITRDGVSIEFEYISPDGEEQYPGKLTTRVKYELNNRNQLVITFHAVTDKTTVVNLTNHTYWNLSGDAKHKIYDHFLTLHCDHYLPVDDAAIPSGEIKSVSKSAFDFTSPKEMKSQMLQISGGGKPGIDHCFVVNGALDSAGGYIYETSLFQSFLRTAAEVSDPVSRRKMVVQTTQPGIQVYTSNFLPDDSANHPFTMHNAIALETQHFPDAPNKPHFPSVTLRPNETYHHQSIYSFSVDK